jgi:PKD repeat protein
MPSTPTGLAGTATNPTTVALSWQPSTGSVDHYDVFRDGAVIGTAPPAASPSFTDRTATGATTYAYSVAAVDAAGGSSAQSAAVQVTTPAADTTGPTVLSSTPSDGATGVAVAANVTATFSEALATATVNGQTFTLEDAAGAVVPASVSYDGPSTTATLNPDADLASGATYTATISGVTDAAGNAMSSDASWSFSTVAAPAPVASFTAAPTSGQAPLPVQFTDTSTGNPTTWSWDFGDGTTATTQNPAHTYTAPGTYTVTLTAANGTGPSTTANGTVTVTSPPPTASFTAAPTSGRAPLPVQFTDTSTGGATSWAWDFGDGTTATTQNPAHTYTTPGTYTVTLTASNSTGASAPVTATVTATGVKFRASSTATGANTGVAIPRPAGVANGDVLVMQLTAEQNPTLSNLSGWTAIPSTPLTVGTGIREFAFYHVVTNAAAEPASYSWQLSTKLKWGAVLTAFSGVSTASPLETAASTQVNTTAVSSLTIPGVTTTGTGAMLIGAIGLNNPGTAATAATGWTLAADSAGTQRAVLAYRYMGTPAASGNLTWSLSKAAPSGGWLIALHAAG